METLRVGQALGQGTTTQDTALTSLPLFLLAFQEWNTSANVSYEPRLHECPRTKDAHKIVHSKDVFSLPGQYP